MADGKAEINIKITHGSKTYEPVIADETTVEWTRFGSPGKLVFNALVDSTLKFGEGDAVRMTVDGKNFFFGFLFTYERVEKGKFRFTVYDVLRYLKSDDIFKMPKQTYSKALKKVLKRYGLKAGTIENTKYVRKGKVYTGCVLDMLEDYRKATRSSKGVNYILYAKFDKVCLKPQSSMKTDYVFKLELMENFSYASSIDNDVYTVVKLYKTKGKKTSVYTKTTKAAKKKYGRLTYIESTKLDSKSKIKRKLKSIAKAHKSPKKKLTLSGVFGLTAIRAGSGVTVKIREPGVIISKSMTVDSVTHRFKAGSHTMDITVVGGQYTNG